MKEDTRHSYHERINKVVYYINNHLDGKLSLEHLASLGNYSPYHFHRIMRAYLGESIGAYIARIRLETSVHLLKMTSMPVGEVALKVGYENHASFNKAFKKRFGISPQEYRLDHETTLQIYGSNLKLKIMENLNSKPKIKEIKPIKVIKLPPTKIPISVLLTSRKINAVITNEA